MTSRGLASRLDSAEERLDRYTDPTRDYAFATYDRRPANDGPLEPGDILMANLLSLRLGWREVIPLFADRQGPEHNLRVSLDKALSELRDVPAFETYDSPEALESAVASLAAANDATGGVRGWTGVTVSKVLHRRRPHIVPIVDSRVRAFYGARNMKKVRAALWEDIRESADELRVLADRYRKSDAEPLSLLRVADILIWMP